MGYLTFLLAFSLYLWVKCRLLPFFPTLAANLAGDLRRFAWSHLVWLRLKPTSHGWWSYSPSKTAIWGYPLSPIFIFLITPTYHLAYNPFTLILNTPETKPWFSREFPHSIGTMGCLLLGWWNIHEYPIFRFISRCRDRLNPPSWPTRPSALTLRLSFSNRFEDEKAIENLDRWILFTHETETWLIHTHSIILSFAVLFRSCCINSNPFNPFRSKLKPTVLVSNPRQSWSNLGMDQYLWKYHF